MSRRTRQNAPAYDGSSPFAKTLQDGKKRLRFRSATSNAVLFASQFSLPKISFPDLIYVRDMLPGAPADYAMIVSTNHALDNTDGVYLAWVKNPLDASTYTISGRIYQDRVVGISTETPRIIKVPELGLFYLYYQQSGAGNNQSTVLAVSADLVTWERIGVVIDYTEGTMPGDGHTGNYGPIQRLAPDKWTALTLMGGTTYGRHGISRSVDGVRWHMDPNPISPSIESVRDPSLIDSPQGGFFVFNGELWGLGRLGVPASGLAVTNCEVVAGPVTRDYRNWIGRPTQVWTPLAGTESHNIQSATVAVMGDALYLLVTVDSDVHIAVGEAY